ncbi:3-deoxy-manno-octulosonate cytidylyltransferase [Runella limosa]|uniref:3-deoxy-manno-octulosonate cytidylyltransferase n=1 Tax=Runella limosa TaxID=370978 RepID=UPI0004267261|nr:3-deoxy-manno-octulosonate cytidylyltransferase [Runella limosa]
MIIGIIPSRYASTRFPGKPLADILGKTMIQRVYEQASQAKCLSKVIVATEDKRIVDHVESFGGQAIMTSTNHFSGTERCFEAYELIKKSELELTDSQQVYIINIQGDEPFLVAEQVDELGAILDGKVEIASQIIPCSDNAILFDEREAKVIVNTNQEAIYFSRHVLPYFKGIPQEEWYKHHTYYRQVGMYAYRADILEKITQLPVSDLEIAESLEQLRWVQNGYKIKMALTKYESHCIDTIEDIGMILNMLGLH